jgi:hypothetical protein
MSNQIGDAAFTPFAPLALQVAMAGFHPGRPSRRFQNERRER